MHKLKILKKKDIKKIIQIINNQWDAEIDLNYEFLMNNKDKIFIVNRECFNIDETKLRIDSLGSYFGQTIRNEMRLSIEGSQMIGPLAKKNIIELDDEEIKQWVNGKELDLTNKKDFDNSKFNGFLLIKNKSDFYGCGSIKDNNILLNYYPKARRIDAKI